MAVGGFAHLACLLLTYGARLSACVSIATTASNTPPFSLQCASHYQCRSSPQKFVSVRSVQASGWLPSSKPLQCNESETLNIRSQAEAFLNSCAPGAIAGNVTLTSGCLTQWIRSRASGQVNIMYECVAAAATATTQISVIVTMDATGNTSTPGGESSSKTAAGAPTTVAVIAAAVVLSIAACSVAAMVLVCWRSGLLCFAVGNASKPKTPATAPPYGARIAAEFEQPRPALHYSSTTLVQQHGLHPAGNQPPVVGAIATSSPAVVRYVSLSEQDDHSYEALPDPEDAPTEPIKSSLIYDEVALSSSPPPSPSHRLNEGDSTRFDAATEPPQEAESNFYFTLESRAKSEIRDGGHDDPS